MGPTNGSDRKQYEVQVHRSKTYSETRQIMAASLAEVCNIVRDLNTNGRWCRVQIWAPSGLLAVDTNLGDIYNLI